MPEYDNRNTFTLFRNTKKREGKQDADFNGSFTDASGTEYWVNAWSKTPKAGGEKFLSGSMRAKENKQVAPAPAPRMDDDLPF